MVHLAVRPCIDERFGVGKKLKMRNVLESRISLDVCTEIAGFARKEYERIIRAGRREHRHEYCCASPSVADIYLCDGNERIGICLFLYECRCKFVKDGLRSI